jgi:uncharacterized Zn-finger protein
MDTIVNEEKICPKCGKSYKGRPALSREDNQTPICPLCGTREALASLGIKPDEIEVIIQKIPKIEES